MCEPTDVALAGTAPWVESLIPSTAVIAINTAIAGQGRFQKVAAGPAERGVLIAVPLCFIGEFFIYLLNGYAFDSGRRVSTAIHRTRLRHTPQDVVVT